MKKQAITLVLALSILMFLTLQTSAGFYDPHWTILRSDGLTGIVDYKITQETDTIWKVDYTHKDETTKQDLKDCFNDPTTNKDKCDKLKEHPKLKDKESQVDENIGKIKDIKPILEDNAKLKGKFDLTEDGSFTLELNDNKIHDALVSFGFGTTILTYNDTFLVYFLGLSSPDFFVNVDLLYNTPQCFNCVQDYNLSSNKSGVLCTVSHREVKGLLTPKVRDMRLSEKVKVKYNETKHDYITVEELIDFENLSDFDKNFYKDKEKVDGKIKVNKTKINNTWLEEKTKIVYEEKSDSDLFELNSTGIIIRYTGSINNNEAHDIIPKLSCIYNGEVFDLEFPEYAWWNASWLLGKSFNLTESSGVARVNYPVNYNFTGLSCYSSDEIRILNQSCNGAGGIEFPYKVVSSSCTGSGSDSVDLTMLANATASADTEYCILYNNSGVAAPTYTWNLELYLDFEEEGTIDKSGSGNDGTVGSVPWNSTGGIGSGGAYEFGGISGHNISLGNIETSDGTAFTINLWYKEIGLGPDVHNLIYSSGGRSVLIGSVGIATNSQVNIVTFREFQELTLDSGINPGVGDWHHVAVTMNTTNDELFVNGSSTDTGSNTYAAGGGNDLIGGDAEGTSKANATIDEIMVWNISLSDSIITGLAAVTKPSLTLGVEESGTTTSTTTTTTTIYVDTINNTISNLTVIFDSFYALFMALLFLIVGFLILMFLVDSFEIFNNLVSKKLRKK